MFKKSVDKNRELREEIRVLKMENIRLKNELESIKSREKTLNKLIVDCELLKKEWEENLKEAKAAKDSFNNLYRELRAVSDKYTQP